VLVDRVWPRGLAKQQAQIDAWLKELAPSSKLRTWFNHEAAKWQDFKRRYFAELDHNRKQVEQLIVRARAQHLTVVFAAKNRELNNAVALKEYVEKRQE
jgi:uncharacterized protein YeaO (DUF488 family)